MLGAASSRRRMTSVDVSHASQVTELVQRLRHMHLDVTEYTCLKALVLFRPGEHQATNSYIRISIVLSAT